MIVHKITKSNTYIHVICRLFSSNSSSERPKKSSTIKVCQICGPRKVEAGGTVKLHKQPSPWRGKHSFEFDLNPYCIPIFKTNPPIFTHMDGANIAQNETQQHHNDYVVFHQSQWITSFMPPFQLSNVSDSSSLPSKSYIHCSSHVWWTLFTMAMINYFLINDFVTAFCWLSCGILPAD